MASIRFANDKNGVPLATPAAVLVAGMRDFLKGLSTYMRANATGTWSEKLIEQLSTTDRHRQTSGGIRHSSQPPRSERLWASSDRWIRANRLQRKRSIGGQKVQVIDERALSDNCAGDGTDVDRRVAACGCTESKPGSRPCGGRFGRISDLPPGFALAQDKPRSL